MSGPVDQQNETIEPLSTEHFDQQVDQQLNETTEPLCTEHFEQQVDQQNETIEPLCTEHSEQQVTGIINRFRSILTLKRVLIGVGVAIAVVLVIVVSVVISTQSKTSHDGLKPTIPPEKRVEKKNSCLLHDTYKYKENEDRLGELCNISSQVVKDECAKIGANFKCEPCRISDRQEYFLPNFCFCDNYSHCSPNGRAYDNWEKKTCKECSASGSCPCLHGGVCTCNNTFNPLATNLICDCPKVKGYQTTGKYCENGPKRLCTRNSTIPTDLEYCRRTSKDPCYIYSSAHNVETMICAILKDDSEAKGLEPCVVK